MQRERSAVTAAGVEFGAGIIRHGLGEDFIQCRVGGVLEGNSNLSAVQDPIHNHFVQLFVQFFFHGLECAFGCNLTNLMVTSGISGSQSGIVLAEKNLLLVKGAVPGPKKALVTIKETVKAQA